MFQEFQKTPMKRLKTILLSRKFFVACFLLIAVYIILFTKVIKYNSIYENGEIAITGTIKNLVIKEDKINFIIKGKETFYGTYYPKEHINFKIGSIVNISGIASEPNKNSIPNAFNFKKYLYNNKIYKQIKIKDIKVIKKSSSILVKLKNFIYQRCKNNKYLSLFIVGDKSMLESEVYDSFKNNGVAHLLAISGMHVSVFVLILKKILKYFRQNYQNMIISLFLLLFAYIVNFSPSIVRVVIMFILEIINKKYMLNLKSWQILFYTAFILLIINPFWIYHIGFLYSFVTSLGIILCQKYHNHNYFLNILIITFFALLFTLPITLMINYEINLTAFLTNLLLIPFITFFLYPFSLIVFCFPFLLVIYNFFTLLMEKIIVIIDNISFLNIVVPKLNIFVIIIYYCLLILFIYFGYKRVLIMMIILLLSYKFSFKLDANNRIIFFDVGQGDASVIVSSYQKDVIIIDTGGVFGDYKVTNNIILFLKSIGITSINKMIISHGDYDHIGEAINLVNNFKVEKVIFNCGPYNDLEKELIKVLDKKKIKYYSCIKELNIDNNKLYFLQTKEYNNENDNSNVIYTELDGYKFMFMGDASITTEKEILSKYNLPDIDILKVGHHGSKTSSSEEFINKINPKYSVVSVGKNNRYGHPNKEALNNLEKSKIYRTDQDGSIMFKIKNNKLKIETCSP